MSAIGPHVAGTPAEPMWMAGSPAEPGSTRDASRVVLSGEAAVRFRGVVDNHYDFIWRFLRGLGVAPFIVDDAAQQVFLVAAQRLSEIQPGSERAFLFSTARGIAANARRAQARRREILDEDALAERSDDTASPEEIATANQARKLLDAFLDTLSDDVREVFILFELEGMTMATISETTGVPAGTVASRLRRAREQFQAAAKRFQAQRGGRP